MTPDRAVFAGWGGCRPSKGAQLVSVATICSIIRHNLLFAWSGDPGEGGRPYVVLCAECRASMADFTFADTSSVSRTVNPAVETGSPTRISSGWHLMW
jgi:hypothetical protein